MRVVIGRGAEHFASDAAARQLLIGPKKPLDLKMQGRHCDLTLGQDFEEQVSAFFELPQLDQRSKIFFACSRSWT